ncbi:amidase [Mesorhizobium sp. BR1-1-16]|uniref:amidase n=1 Tax=Mesorhizobium sp. BR1-1-16 TaxID=2876653 RepID=UPI001CCA5B09|nr:amidase [Mesorhizobium sp. BR1-1-16]MBZ9938727.1 amidase [Mesorhizobium sp. BR1-1-16]
MTDMTDDALTGLDALGIADEIRKGALTPQEALDAAIARVDALNPALNAVVHRHDDLARRAIAEGLPDGPFRGVPFLLKDLDLRLAGTVTTSGSHLFDGIVATRDSTLTARYKAAGLVIFGKTNAAELGLSSATEPAAFGPTRHPLDPALSPGGSSGGSAAAVASGMVPMAHATDGAGSIRMPASLTGIFGMKPSRGRTPVGPDASEIFFGMSVNHAITMTVRDSAALLDATSGPEPGARYGLAADDLSFLEQSRRDPAPLRIALMTEPFGAEPVEGTCRDVAIEAAHLAAALGHHVEEARPSLDGIDPAHCFRRLAAALTLVFVEDVAAPHGIADPRALLEPVNVAWMDEAKGLTAGDQIRAIGEMHAIGRALARFFERYDVLITPVTAQSRLPHGHFNGAETDVTRFVDRLTAFGPFTFPFNAGGMPAMSVPVTRVGGLPVGAQFASALGRDGTLFALAGQIERARPWHRLTRN